MAGNKRIVAALAIAVAGGAIAAAAILVLRHNAPARVTSRSESPISTGDVHGKPAAQSAPLPRTTTDASPPAAPDTSVGHPAVVAEAPPAAQVDPPSSVDTAASPVIPNSRRSRRAAAGGGEMTPAAPVAPLAVEPLIPVPQARMALSFVGADPMAEDVWVAAINDPALPPETRKDLIEDLNEDGFPDPKHITEDDLPLIMNRLELITTLAPESMDDVNAAAFEEAYKDLVNMVYRLLGQ
jgi:hypothetical protein